MSNSAAIRADFVSDSGFLYLPTPLLITSPSPEPGKCRPNFGAFFGFGHEAVHVKQYEVLVGDSRGVRWVPSSGTFSFEKLGARPVEGGHEDDGTPLVIARARAKEHSGILGIGGGGKEGLFPGKASPKLSGAYVTVGDKEVKVDVSVIFFFYFPSC